jgi:hypothetical protein
MLTRCFLRSCYPVSGCLVLVAGLLLLQGLFAPQLSAHSRETDSPASKVDLRPAFEEWGIELRLQGKRRTCSVFTVAGALEYALACQCDQGTQLSVEFLNWASNQTLGEMEDGSFFSDLWQGFTTYGVCPEQDMPYQSEFDPNRTPNPAALDRAHLLQRTNYRLHWIKPWDPNTGLSETQLADIKRTLHRQWPVCGGFRWPKKPVRWNHGILEMPPPEGVFDGHSVLLVGYQDDPKQAGGGVFVFRNSNHLGRERYMTYAYAIAYMNDALWIEYKTKP